MTCVVVGATLACMATTLKTGTLVTPTPNDTTAVEVIDSTQALAMGFGEDLFEKGWQLARFLGTDARILVRVVSSQGFTVSEWASKAVAVEVAGIETAVREDGGRWVVVGELGEIRNTKWIARLDQTVVIP